MLAADPAPRVGSGGPRGFIPRRPALHGAAQPEASPLHSKFHKLLHDYKLEVFKVEHDKRSTEQITQECVQIADEVLAQKFNYHFHKLPDANRAEIINMISNYTREAILPPVVSKLVQRQVVLEKRVDRLAQLVENLLGVLSERHQTAAGATLER